MKIVVRVTVELADPAQWTQAFGTTSAQDIRQSIKNYIGSDLQDYGVFGNGEVDATISWV